MTTTTFLHKTYIDRNAVGEVIVNAHMHYGQGSRGPRGTHHFHKRWRAEQALLRPVRLLHHPRIENLHRAVERRRAWMGILLLTRTPNQRLWIAVVTTSEARPHGQHVSGTSCMRLVQSSINPTISTDVFRRDSNTPSSMFTLR